MSRSASEAVKTSAFVRVSVEMLVDGLPFRTMLWPEPERVAEYLRYGQSVTSGHLVFNPAHVAESVEWVQWDDDDWLPHLDWPEWDDE